MIVRDYDEARLQLAIELQHQAQHVLAVPGVKVAGWLISQDQLRSGDKCPRDGGTLAFAAR